MLRRIEKDARVLYRNTIRQYCGSTFPTSMLIVPITLLKSYVFEHVQAR